MIHRQVTSLDSPPASELPLKAGCGQVAVHIAVRELEKYEDWQAGIQASKGCQFTIIAEETCWTGELSGRRLLDSEQ